MCVPVCVHKFVENVDDNVFFGIYYTISYYSYNEQD